MPRARRGNWACRGRHTWGKTRERRIPAFGEQGRSDSSARSTASAAEGGQKKSTWVRNPTVDFLGRAPAGPFQMLLNPRQGGLPPAGRASIPELCLLPKFQDYSQLVHGSNPGAAGARRDDPVGPGPSRAHCTRERHPRHGGASGRVGRGLSCWRSRRGPGAAAAAAAAGRPSLWTFENCLFVSARLSASLSLPGLAFPGTATRRGTV